jgi:membrane-associated phospholipid phosphatase
LASIERWDDAQVVLPWTLLALDLIKIHELNPVRASRALALFHTAMFDTVVSTLDAQSAFPQPSPAIVDQNLKLLGSTALNPLSFPSEHAAVAAAAAVVLTYLFPDEPSDRLTSLADEAAMSRVSAGRAFRRDIEAGQAIGAVVGQRAVARGMADGSSLAWNGQNAPEGSGVWQATPPAFIQDPVDPLAGTWRPWILPSGSAYRPGPPPAYGSPAFQAELAAVQEAVTHRTSEQVAAVLYWAAGPGTVTPAGLWIEIARNLIMRDELDALQAALVLARTSVAMADSSICCWDAKYTYWTLRPITADPDLDVLIPTPPFPSYTSGHSTISAAAATVLGHVFPTDQTELAAKATEAKDSRLWAGIHFPIDNEMGALGGSVIGRLISQTGEGIYAASADGG